MIILAFFLLVLNVGISWWNCYVCGKSWDSAKVQGSWAVFLNWCGVIQSAVGFSMPILLVEALMFNAYGYPKAMHAVLNLWYLAVIFPVLGSGLAITIDSIRTAWISRTPGSIFGAIYNTSAMASNIYSATSGIGESTKGLLDFFKSDDEDNTIATLVIAAVAVALFGGAFVTYMLIKKYRAKAFIEARRGIVA